MRLEALGIIKKYPRKIDEIKNGLNLIRNTDPYYKDKYGYNIIHEGALRSDINLIQQGIKIGVDVNGRSYIEEYTPLHFVRCTEHWSNDDKSASNRSPIVFPIGFLLDADWRILDHIYDCRSWSINGGNRSTIAPNRTDYWN